MSRYGAAVLRLAVAAVFVAHGGQKLFGLWGGHGLGQTAAFLTALGLTPAYPLAILVAVTEFFGGVLLALGWWGRWAALALALDMGVALYRVHLHNGFFLNWNSTPGRGHGIEYNVVLIGALLSIVLTGAGALSVDEWRSQSAEAKARGRARARTV